MVSCLQSTLRGIGRTPTRNLAAEAVQCDRYRPDFLWDIVDEQRIVILERDEHAHRSETVRCEFIRPMRLALGFGGSPVHMIRYNPDLLTCVKTMPKRRARGSVAGADAGCFGAEP